MAGLSGSAVSAAANNVTPPVGAVGDLMVVFAYRTASNTAPILPGGWTNLDNTGGSSNAFRAGYKIATSTTDSSGTWTNATDIVLFRLSGQTADPGWIGGATHNTGTGTTITYGAVTLSGSGSNWMLSFAGCASATALGTRTGYSRDTAAGSAPLVAGEHIRNPAGTLQTVTATGSGTFITFQQEILTPAVSISATRPETATITPAASLAKPISATRTTTATVSPAATTSKPITATRSITAAISPTAVSSKPVAATRTTTATITPSATSAKPVAVSLSATATVSPSAALAKPVTAARSTTATATPSTTLAKPVSASAATAATITPAATVTPGGTPVNIAAAPTFTAAVVPAATVAKPVTSSLTATSSRSSAATVAKPVASASATTATVSPASTITKPVAATRATATTITPAASSAKPVTATLGVAVARTPVAVATKPDSASVTGSAALTATSTVGKPITATRATAAALTAAVGLAKVATATRTTSVAITPVAVSAKTTAASLSLGATISVTAEVLPPPQPVEFSFGRPGNNWALADPVAGWLWTAPGIGWWFAEPVDTWTWSPPAVSWAIGGPMAEQYSALAVQFVPVPVQGKRAGQPINPTGDDVFLAFMDGRRQPGDPDWVTGSWDTTATLGVYLAQALIGPGTDAELTPGTYSVWVKIVDDPETPVDQVGEITVY